MYKPKFNHVLVEINDKDAKWGKGNDDNLGGEVYREGTLISIADHFFNTEFSPVGDIDFDEIVAGLRELIGKTVMWNEGHEAGTVFEVDEKKYALIYWFDLIGAKDGQ